MEKFILNPTFETPSILLDSENGIIELSGRSLPEDTIHFYRPVLNWVDEFLLNPKPKTEILIKLEYFNTATSKVLLNLLSRFKKSENVIVRWYYYEEDEDMLESGKEFEELVNLPFSFHYLD
jgi:hypothetical protein